MAEIIEPIKSGILMLDLLSLSVICAFVSCNSWACLPRSGHECRYLVVLHNQIDSQYA